MFPPLAQGTKMSWPNYVYYLTPDMIIDRGLVSHHRYQNGVLGWLSTFFVFRSVEYERACQLLRGLIGVQEKYDHRGYNEIMLWQMRTSREEIARTLNALLIDLGYDDYCYISQSEDIYTNEDHYKRQGAKYSNTTYDYQTHQFVAPGQKPISNKPAISRNPPPASKTAPVTPKRKRRPVHLRRY